MLCAFAGTWGTKWICSCLTESFVQCLCTASRWQWVLMFLLFRRYAFCLALQWLSHYVHYFQFWFNRPTFLELFQVRPSAQERTLEIVAAVVLPARCLLANSFKKEVRFHSILTEWLHMKHKCRKSNDRSWLFTVASLWTIYSVNLISDHVFIFD